MTVSERPITRSSPGTGISTERQHFETHGWILIKNALDATQVQHYRYCIDRAIAGQRICASTPDGGHRVNRTILNDKAFIDFLCLPGILERYNDIAGTAAVLKNSWAFRNQINYPDSGALSFPYDQDGNSAGWHRGSSPKWAMHEDEDHPGMHHFPYLNYFVYLTDVGVDNGGTLAMDGSHKVSGEYERVKQYCQPIAVEAKAGDMFLFTESLMHSGPVYFKQQRYTMVYTIVPTFYCNQQGSSNPAWFYEHIDNDDLRGVLGEWRGIISPHRFGLDQPYHYNFEKPRQREPGYFIKGY